MTRELLHFRIILLGLFVFLFLIFHINIRIQVVSLGYEVSELRSQLDQKRRKEWELQLQREKLMSAKSIMRLLAQEPYLGFHLPRSDQVIYVRDVHGQ